MTIWLAGAVGIGMYLGVGILAAGRLRRRAAPAPWADEARALAGALGVPGSVAFVESASAGVPMVCGFLRPAVVMPCDAATWPPERLHAALIHELAHVRRRDCLTQTFAQALCALHWFNPLVWLAARQLRAERERACDDFVLEAGTRGSAYAAHLLEIARTMGSRMPAYARAGVSMAHRSQLEGRLMAILNPAIRRSAAQSTRAAAVAATLAVAVPLAAVQPQDPPEQTEHQVILRADNLEVDVKEGVVILDGAATVATGQARWEGDKLLVHEMIPRNSGESTAGLLGSADRLFKTLTLSRGPGREPAERPRARAVDRALVDSAAEGDMQGVNDLIAAGADVNAVVEVHGGTPLIAAAREGNLEMVRLLLDRGADPNLSVMPHGNAITAAAVEGRKAIVELLLQRGAFVDQTAEGDQSALTQASGAGRLDMVKLLVSRGADVNSRAWIATQEFVVQLDRESGEIEKVVLTGRVSHASTGEWRSPLSAARRGEHKAVVDYLVGAGARD
jgi:hypothetical protein